MWIETEIEHDAVQYLVAHKEGLREKLFPEAKLFLERSYMFQGEFRKPFINAYEAFMVGLIRLELMDGLNISAEYLLSMVTKDFIFDILGEEFFLYIELEG